MVLADFRKVPNDSIGCFGIPFGGNDSVRKTDGCRYLCNTSKTPLNHNVLLFRASGTMPLSIQGLWPNELMRFSAIEC